MTTRRACLAALAIFAMHGFAASLFAVADGSLAGVIRDVQGKIVKIYGAGGFRGLEPYQSGFLISPEGHILTAHSYVLDADYITCTLDGGQKFEAKLLGADPRLEIAVLKIDAKDLPYFDLSKSPAAAEGTRALAFSNLFGIAVGDEPASVQHGIVAAVSPLEARRGVFETLYGGRVYVLDAMTNNPGAAGGALTNARGELIGILGKELRNARNNTWLNYAVPIAELTASVDLILAGKAPTVSRSEATAKLPNPMTLEALGIVMMPNVLPRTPAFIEKVRAGSPAAKAGVKPDDMVVFVEEELIQSVSALRESLSRIALDDRVKLTLQRERQLLEVTLEADAPAALPATDENKEK